MNSKIIKLSKKTCIEEISNLFNEYQTIRITKQDENSIQFKKGKRIARNMYSIRLEGLIIFEGNDETNVSILYNRSSMKKFLAIELLILIAIISAFTVYDILFSKLNWVNFIFLMSPISFFFIELIMVNHYLNKGEKIFAEELFKYLGEFSDDEE